MFRLGLRWRLFFISLLLPVLGGLPVLAQTSNPGTPDQSSSGSPSVQPPTADPLKRPISEKQKKKNAKALTAELEGSYKKWLNEDVAWIITDEERRAFLQPPTTKSATSSSRLSGSVAIPLLIPKRTSSRKSTTAGSSMLTNTLPPELPAGAPIVAESTSCMGLLMKLTLIPLAGPTTVPLKREAAQLRPIRSKTGDIVTSKASDKKSLSNSWTSVCAVNTT